MNSLMTTHIAVGIKMFLVLSDISERSPAEPFTSPVGLTMSPSPQLARTRVTSFCSAARAEALFRANGHQKEQHGKLWGT